jgi:hypothetical protein
MAGRIFDGFAGGVMAKGGAKMTQRWLVFAVTTRRSSSAPPTTRSALVSE